MKICWDTLEGMKLNNNGSFRTSSCIALCKNCNKDIHKQKGYRYVDLQCK